MRKPSNPLQPGGEMTAVAMLITLGVFPATVMGTGIGAALGAGAGAIGLASGIAAGALAGAGIAVGLGIAASAFLIAAPFIGYGINMAKWKFGQKFPGKSRDAPQNAPTRAPGLSLKKTAHRLQKLASSFTKAKDGKPGQNGPDTQKPDTGSKPPTP